MALLIEAAVTVPPYSALQAAVVQFVVLDGMPPGTPTFPSHGTTLPGGIISAATGETVIARSAIHIVTYVVPFQLKPDLWFFILPPRFEFPVPRRDASIIVPQDWAGQLHRLILEQESYRKDARFAQSERERQAKSLPAHTGL